MPTLTFSFVLKLFTFFDDFNDFFSFWDLFFDILFC